MDPVSYPRDSNVTAAVLEVMRMTSLVTFTSAPAILGGKKNCSALSAALTYGTVARPESSSAGADCL